jgi:hypothetical protein
VEASGAHSNFSECHGEVRHGLHHCRERSETNYPVHGIIYVGKLKGVTRHWASVLASLRDAKSCSAEFRRGDLVNTSVA